MNQRSIAGILVFAVFAAAPLRAEEISASQSYKLTAQPALPTLSLPAVAAKVNGEEISINKFWNALVAASGNTVLNGMIEEILLNQEFGKKFKKPKTVNARISAQVDERIADIRKQFPTEEAFVSRLQSSGLGLEDLKKQVRLQIVKEKLIEDKISVSAKELKKYWDDNKDKLPKGTAWDDKTKKQLESYMKQTKFNDEYPKYIQAVRQKSDIKILLNP